MEEAGIHDVKTCSLHPGVVRTEIWGKAGFTKKMGSCKKCIAWTLFYLSLPFWTFGTKNMWYGAQTQLYCSMCPFEELESGAYYADCRVAKTNIRSSNWMEECQKLWNVT